MRVFYHVAPHVRGVGFTTPYDVFQHITNYVRLSLPFPMWTRAQNRMRLRFDPARLPL